MPETVDLDDVIRQNPDVDGDELERLRELLRQVRERGGRRAGYNLALPFEGRRVHVGNHDKDDPRVVHLRLRSK